MQVLRIPRRAAARPPVRPRGFTAIELMVTIAVLAILVALAAPSFNSLAERWRVRQTANDIQSAIYFARSEGIKRGGNVTFAANGGAWTGGWVVSSGGTPLQKTAAPNGATITVTSGGAAQTSFDVTRWGMLALSADKDTAVAATVLVTPQGKDAASPNAMLLCVGVAGRIEAKSGASQTC